MRHVVALGALLAFVACAGGDTPEATPLPIPRATDEADAGDAKTARLRPLGETTEPDCPRGIEPDPLSFTWLDGADMPTPRTEVAGAALAGRVYVAGGFTADGDASDAVEAYDPHADTWERAVGLPEPVHHAGLAEAGGRLWLVGGYNSDGSPTSAVWSWAPGERRWTPGPGLRTPRGALAVVSVHEHLVATGGATGFGGGELSDATEVLAPEAARWERAPPLPDARDHLAAAGLSLQTLISGGRKSVRGSAGEVHVFGGRKLSLESNTARMDELGMSFEPEADPEWQSFPRMPRARGGFAAAAYDVEIFVFGGEEPEGTIAPLDYYELAKGVWCTGPDMPTPRHGLAAVTLGDRIYVVGGGPEPGLTVSGANEILCFGDCR